MSEIIPELRFPMFNEQWEEKLLKDFILISAGKDYKHLNEGAIPVYGTGGYMLSVSDSLSSEDAIGIGRKGTINKPYFLKAPFWTVDTLFFCVPKENNDVFFLLGLFKNIRWEKYDESTGVPSLSKNTLNKITQWIPGYSEQKKIGEFFNKLDRQIELEEQKLEKLEEQKKGYMQQIFSQELRFKDDDGNDYLEWESKNFLEIFKLVPSKNKQIKSSEVVENGIIPVVDQGKDIFLGYSNEKDKAIEDFDNVIVYGDHTTIVKYIKEPFIIGGDGVKLLASNDGSLIHYLYILLQYFNVNPEGYKRHYSILKTKMMNISNTKEEQEKIGNFFEKQDNLIEKQSNKIELLKERKKGFLQKMFV